MFWPRPGRAPLTPNPGATPLVTTTWGITAWGIKIKKKFKNNNNKNKHIYIVP